jgi:hypothetical protein
VLCTYVVNKAVLEEIDWLDGSVGMAASPIFGGISPSMPAHGLSRQPGACGQELEMCPHLSIWW